MQQTCKKMYVHGMHVLETHGTAKIASAAFVEYWHRTTAW